MCNHRRSAVIVVGMTMLFNPWSTGFAASESAAYAAASKSAGTTEINRGRYMVLVSHCNNCHTAGYTTSHGNLPERQWLLGNPVGYRGPAGTTYASNLRLSVGNFTEEQWVNYAKAVKPRPPMPWWSLHATADRDLRAMYKYIRHLGPAGQPAPQYLPPDREPNPPYELRQLVKGRR